MLVLVSSYPRRSLKLLKYQQIISRAATKFKGLAWVSYDEQFCRRAAYDLSMSWDQINLELWTVTFSGLAQLHCLTCSNPYHSQSECPSNDPSRAQPKGALVCFRFNRSSGCTTSSCPYPHVCRRCSASDHSIIHCPAGAPSIRRDSRAQDKVRLLARNSIPSVSTPINIDILERELSRQPDHNFSASLITYHNKWLQQLSVQSHFQLFHWHSNPTS